MHELVTLLIFAIPVAGLGWFVWTSTPANQRKTKAAALQKLRSSNRYRGITIRNGKCAAVRRYTGSFYSLDMAPELPVEGCKALRCSCVYTGLNNRRYQERRGKDDPRSVVRFGADSSDRREHKNRRGSDHIKWQDPAD